MKGAILSGHGACRGVCKYLIGSLSLSHMHQWSVICSHIVVCALDCAVL